VADISNCDPGTLAAIIAGSFAVMQAMVKIIEKLLSSLFKKGEQERNRKIDEIYDMAVKTYEII
jgi:hypothetical protein